MRFTVSTADGVQTSYDGTYTIEGGVLTVRDYDSDEVVLLSPGFWHVLRAAGE